MRIFRTIIVLLISFCLTPPCVLLAAGLIARWSGCAINSDAPEACPALWGDFGPILYSMVDFGWLTVETVPILGALIISWLVIEIFRPAAGPAQLPDRTLPSSRSRLRGLAARF
jgi:hypothetical protein